MRSSLSSCFVSRVLLLLFRDATEWAVKEEASPRYSFSIDVLCGAVELQADVMEDDEDVDEDIVW